jgi:AraC-like DNA-binding protein
MDGLLARHAFQRACVELCKKRGGVVCGRVGDHGIALLVDDAASGQRLRSKLVEIGDRAAALAKRHGLRLHVGISAPDDDGSLPLRHQAALAAADEALSRGLAVVHAERRRRVVRLSPLGELHQQLSVLTRKGPASLAPRFDRYIEAVERHCGYRMEPTRAYLEAGLYQITDALGTTLEERSLTDLWGMLDRATTVARTVEDLSEAYRGAVRDIELAVSHPTPAREDRSIRRALTFVRDHIGDPLSVARVARVAGFSPSHFSRLFAKSEHTTFQRYARRLRVERAKQLLLSTTLSAERIGQLCGFPNRSHFHRAFRQTVGMAPLEYRNRATSPVQVARGKGTETAFRGVEPA